MDASALARELDNLEKSWSGLDFWLNVWTLLVVAGVAIELIVLIVEYLHDWRAFKRAATHPSEKPSLLVYGLGFLGAALVALGVAGEFHVHIVAGKIENDMREASRRLVALAEGDAAANERAEKAAESASKANEHASANEKESKRLQSDLMNARSALTSKQAALEREQQRTAEAQRAAAQAQLEMRKYVDDVAEFETPRVLLPSLMDELMRKPPGKAEILFEAPGDLQHWSSRLYNMLRSVRWIVSPPKLISQDVMPNDSKGAFLPATMRLGGRPTGITLVVATWGDRESAPIVALFGALRKQLGDEVSINSDASVSANTVRIVVAHKPFPTVVRNKQ